MQVLLWIGALLLAAAAAALGAVAFRMAQRGRERESARVELLKALAIPDLTALPASGPSISDWTPEFVSEQDLAPAQETQEPASSIFGEHENQLTTLPRWSMAVFAVGAAAILVVTLYFATLGREPQTTKVIAPIAARPTAPATTASQTTAVQQSPIELIALRYGFGKANDFDVNGQVRNPADGHALRQVMAVVDLLDADGRILVSRMTPLERPVLEAGQTSAFSLVFPAMTGDVASYQVGFRSKDGETVLQVDRRASEPDAKAPSF